MDSLYLKPFVNENKNYYYINYEGNNKILGKIDKKWIEVNNDFIEYDFQEIELKFECNIVTNIVKSYFIKRNYPTIIFYLELSFIENEITFKLYYKGNHQIIKKFPFKSSEQMVQGNSSKNYNNIIDSNDLINSTIGLNNFFGNCSINSIIQIFLHTKCFLNVLNELIQNNQIKNSITFLFFKLLESIIKLKTPPQKEFYEFCRYLNDKIRISKNDPMYFCIKFIEILEKENCGKIIHLFSGIKKITFENLKGFDEEKDNFLFYIINLSFEETIENNVFKNKKLQIKDNFTKSVIQKETLIKEPEILMLNIECEIYSKIYSFQIPKKLTINKTDYKLYAINEYNNLHSIA